MAVKPDQRGLVPRTWRASLQRGIDTAAEYADVAAQKLIAAADPRARQLRKRRWALRLGLFCGLTSVLWVLVTGLLAVWSTPVWALLITGLIAAGAAAPATLLLLRYRWLRGEPLPPQRQANGSGFPPIGSAARPAMSALGASERGLHSLLGVLGRGNMLPPEQIRELTATAGCSAAAMVATAAEVAAMERTAADNPYARTHLAPTIDAFTIQLDSGVRQYNDMVTAAAHLVASVNAGATSSTMAQQRHRHELNNATDRLLGWAQAFEELGQGRRV